MKFRHYYRFDKTTMASLDGYQMNLENWEKLRDRSADSSFVLEKTPKSYEENCRKQEAYRILAYQIVDVINKNEIVCDKIISLGAGKGILEWHLKEINPDIRIECTDYTETSVQNLKKVFLKLDEAKVFDMIDGDYTRMEKNSIFIMCRLSAEFTDTVWKSIFRKMNDAGIKFVLFIPNQFADMTTLIKDSMKRLKNWVGGGKKYLFCGWHYTENEYSKMFAETYRVIEKRPVDKTAIYLLQKK